MPFPLVAAHANQLPRLQAQEALQAYELGAATGDIALEKRDRQRLINGWQKAAQPRRRKRRAPITHQERIERLAALGIPVEVEGATDG